MEYNKEEVNYTCTERLERYVVNRVKEFRIKRGITQDALAAAVKTTKRTIFAIERGADVHLSLARKLAQFFECRLDDLYGDEAGQERRVWAENVRSIEFVSRCGKMVALYNVTKTTEEEARQAIKAIEESPFVAIMSKAQYEDIFG
ncbi:MAG: helix-turn-helix domain-containing protein [Oscillospiraceae bacterium]|nr:helix-turn-helix domain-containing protein [Oscillospiraceae bacterium]